MFGVMIFTIVMVILTVGFRFIGSKYYDKIYGKESEKPTVNEVTVREDSDEELVAVISAAANEMLQQNVVVKRIKSISQNESAWSQSGRINAMGTHSVNINR